MAVNIIAVVSVVLALYVLMRADKQKKSHYGLTYALAGLLLLFWSLSMVFWGFSTIMNAMPLIFGLTVIGSLETKGMTQAIFGAFALLVLLSLVV